ncbi:hypothetical protein EIX16_13330 [Escherichia coli]|nr:hypothetical protein [Escherichia coli]EFI8709444.1 hypothetical protein [Escherichia coli]EFN7013816.1 hypothetical protein [Escherichia coli]EFN7058937.1 hypothetical protein [Escherichia coli]EFN7082132.1 hypothetical protein [Escherichia coli]
MPSGYTEPPEIAVLTGAPNRLLGLFSPSVAIAFIDRKHVINGRNINRFIIPSRYEKQSAKLRNIYTIYIYFKFII